MFLRGSVLVVDWLSVIPWVFLQASVFVWDTTGVIAVMVLRAGFGLVPGIRLQVGVLVCDPCGSILGIVFPASALVCGELPLDIFRKVSVFILGGCSRTSGIL